MQLVFLLFLIAVTGTMWGRTRFLKIYKQEASHVLSTRTNGAELVETVLWKCGIKDVAVTKGHGLLPDFYDPDQRRITLSPQHFNASTYSALAIAALQAGKAIQHHQGHRPLLWRTAAIRWGAQLSLPMLLVAIPLVALGMGKTILPLLVLFWCLLAFWNLITIPTEVDAGLRVCRVLEELELFRNLDERIGVERVIGAASTAYIDGISVAISWLGRLLNSWKQAEAN